MPAGTYTEQVFINKSLTLVGENRDTTIIKAPATIPAALWRDPNSSVVKICGFRRGCGPERLHRQRAGPSGCGSIGYGIVVRDGAHANIHDNKILDIRDEPFSGCQNGVGIVVGRSAWSTTGTAEITDNIISRIPEEWHRGQQHRFQRDDHRQYRHRRRTDHRDRPKWNPG